MSEAVLLLQNHWRFLAGETLSKQGVSSLPLVIVATATAYYSYKEFFYVESPIIMLALLLLTASWWRRHS